MDSDALKARKAELRTALRARRRQAYGGPAGAERRRRESAQLLEHAQELSSELADAVGLAEEDGERPMVAAFHPTPTEADVLPLAHALARHGAQLIFPAAAGSELEWITWDGESEFADSPGRGFGKEPTGRRLGPDALSRAALVLAPAVAVDRSGTRIGHGAGYYDRALTHVRPATPVVAVIHPAELLDSGSLPRGAFDVPIRRVLTADGLVTLDVS